MSKQPIGVYDSGVGGLTVLKKLQATMPNENFIYVADNLHVPYGNKTKSEITEYTDKILAWLQNEAGVKMIVAACHTSSALAVPFLRAHYQVPVIDAVHPLLIDSSLLHVNRRVGIIATLATAQSKFHEHILKMHGFQGVAETIACPDFVPFIESGNFGEDLFESAKKYLSVFEAAQLNTLIYGCTHYPFARSVFESILPSYVEHIDPADQIASQCCNFLMENNKSNVGKNGGQVDFFCTFEPEHFSHKIKILTGNLFCDVNILNLNNPLSGWQ
jgi:glutamate racemase